MSKRAMRFVITVKTKSDIDANEIIAGKYADSLGKALRGVVLADLDLDPEFGEGGFLAEVHHHYSSRDQACDTCITSGYDRVR